MEPTDNQNDNSSKPWLWKKGQSGNLMGRPKGKTMKEYARDYLAKMTDDERDEWLEGLPKEVVWKMSEGNPQTNTDITTGGKPIPIYGGKSLDIQGYNSDPEDIPTQEAN